MQKKKNLNNIILSILIYDNYFQVENFIEFFNEKKKKFFFFEK